MHKVVRAAKHPPTDLSDNNTGAERRFTGSPIFVANCKRDKTGAPSRTGINQPPNRQVWRLFGRRASAHGQSDRHRRHQAGGTGDAGDSSRPWRVPPKGLVWQDANAKRRQPGTQYPVKKVCSAIPSWECRTATQAVEQRQQVVRLLPYGPAASTEAGR